MMELDYIAYLLKESLELDLHRNYYSVHPSNEIEFARHYPNLYKAIYDIEELVHDSNSHN